MYHTIEPSREGYVVYEHGVYEHSSVLAGQHKRAWVEYFDSLKEAILNYPKAEILEGSSKLLTEPIVPDLPPNDFDPYACGERWDADY